MRTKTNSNLNNLRVEIAKCLGWAQDPTLGLWLSPDRKMAFNEPPVLDYNLMASIVASMDESELSSYSDWLEFVLRNGVETVTPLKLLVLLATPEQMAEAALRAEGVIAGG